MIQRRSHYLSFPARRAAAVLSVLSFFSGRVPIQRSKQTLLDETCSAGVESKSGDSMTRQYLQRFWNSATVGWFGFSGGPLLVGAACPNLCSGHGECNIYSRCECWDGYQGGDCSELVCPHGTAWSDFARADDIAHLGFADATTGPECSNRGSCDRSTGRCLCMGGWSGNACQRLSCTNDCSDRGSCMSMRKFADRYYNKDSVQYEYNDVWDADMIYGCVCDYPYTGFDCGTRECPTGDDPLTTGQVNEIQVFKCEASSGTLVFLLNGKSTGDIQYNMKEESVAAAIEEHEDIKDVSVTFSFFNGSVCQTSPLNVVQVEFTQDFGDIPPLVPVADRLSDGATVTVSADGTTSISDSDGISYTSVVCTKEGDECSNRGICSVTDGICGCFETNSDTYESSNGYGAAGTRGDCGYPTTVTASCPGDIACSGHGICDDEGSSPTYTCECWEGYMGGDCSMRSCGYGLNWFQYPTSDDVSHDELDECSNAGTCDRATGICNCANWATGGACEYMVCGGGAADPCSGHGRCLSMANLALETIDNGDVTDITYGADPNEATTWDSDSVFGCICDEGYSGYDCTKKTCQLGDDPGTYGQYNELQLVECAADSGTFTLAFRQGVGPKRPIETTVNIKANASAIDVEKALENLYNIDDIEVSFSSGTTACYTSTDSCNIIKLQFVTEHGDVPEVVADGSLLADSTGDVGTGSIDVFSDGSKTSSSCGSLKSVKGDTESEECSNRGLCDRNSGLCTCFAGYGASDGKGNAGSVPDCGYRVGSDVNKDGLPSVYKVSGAGFTNPYMAS